MKLSRYFSRLGSFESKLERRVWDRAKNVAAALTVLWVVVSPLFVWMGMNPTLTHSLAMGGCDCLLWLYLAGVIDTGVSRFNDVGLGSGDDDDNDDDDDFGTPLKGGGL